MNEQTNKLTQSTSNASARVPSYRLRTAAELANTPLPRWLVRGVLPETGFATLYGPSGTGILITSRGDVLQTIIEGGTGSYSANYSQPADMPDRFECGTLNTMGVIGMGAGIAYITERGIESIYNHEINIARGIYERLANMPNIEMYSDFNQEWNLPVLSFNIKGMHSEEATGRLSKAGFALRGGLHCSPLAHEKMDTLEQGAVRISIGALNNETQARRLCDAINKIQQAHGS